MPAKVALISFLAGLLLVSGVDGPTRRAIHRPPIAATAARRFGLRCRTGPSRHRENLPVGGTGSGPHRHDYRVRRFARIRPGGLWFTTTMGGGAPPIRYEAAGHVGPSDACAVSAAASWQADTAAPLLQHRGDAISGMPWAADNDCFQGLNVEAFYSDARSGSPVCLAACSSCAPT